MIISPTVSAGGPLDPNSSEGLLAIANAHGGAVAQTANELVHPSTGILSTVGNGLKKSFKGFLDVLAMPNQIIAGAISPNYTIGEAIHKDISTSDVIFGQRDPHASTMQKVGSFLVRSATDILLDPLTYVTFGASSGAVLGVRGATKIALGENAAASIGREAAFSAVVSKDGQNLYSMLKKVEAQAKGLTKMDELTGGTKIASDIATATGGKITKEEAFDFTRKELKEVLSETIDAPLNIDFAKKALSSLIEKYPQLTETLVDKGGIKFFGQSVLSGQRIRSAVKMVPGMTLLDHATAPIRNSVQALFDPEMVKVGGSGWQRIPEEASNLIQASKDLAESMKDGRINKLSDIVKANKLNVDESRFLLASVEARKLPADERLANAYKQLMAFNKEEFEGLRMAGIPITFLDKHVPHMLVKSDAKVIPFSTPPSMKVGASLKRTLEGSIFNADSGRLEALEEAVLSKEAEKVNSLLGEMKNDGFEIFDDNIVTALARRSVDNTKATVTKNFLDALPSNFAVNADIAPDGWVPLNLSQFKKEEEFLQSIGKSADALRFHPAIAQRVEKFLGSVVNDDATVDAMKAFDSIQNFWKASVTSVFPAFHGRNAISNVFMHFNDLGLQSFNPKNHAIATQLIVADKKLSALTIESMKPQKEAVRLFRGGQPFDASKVSDRGIPLTVNKSVAAGFKSEKDKVPTVLKNANGAVDNIVEEHYLHPNAKIATRSDIPKELYDEYKKSNPFLNPEVGEAALGKWAKQHGFDAIDYRTLGEQSVKEAEIKVLNPEVLSKEPVTNAVQQQIAELMGKKVFTDATGNDWTFGELHRVMKNNNIAFNKNIVGSMDVTKGTQQIVNDLFPVSAKDIKRFAKRQVEGGGQNFAPFKAGRAVGNAIESQARSLDFITNLQKTGDVQMAAIRTKQFLFDYQNLTAFEKTFLRRVMPFYTFTRKNIEMQAKTFLTAPGRTAAQATVLTNLGDAIAGDKLTPEQEAALPDWLKSGISILRKKEGNLVTIYGSLSTPLEAAFSTIQPNNVLGSLSPILRVPVELGSGYNFFQGKPISEATNASAFKHAPKAIKDLIGYTEVVGKNSNGQKYTLEMSLRPGMMHLLSNLPPTTRVLTSLRQVTDENVANNDKILQQLIGLKPYSIDIKQEQQKRENELKKKLGDLLTTAGVTARFTRTYIPKP